MANDFEGRPAPFKISDELSMSRAGFRALWVPNSGRHTQELSPVMSALNLEPQTWENMLKRTEQKSTFRSQWSSLRLDDSLFYTDFGCSSGDEDVEPPLVQFLDSMRCEAM